MQKVRPVLLALAIGGFLAGLSGCLALATGAAAGAAGVAYAQGALRGSVEANPQEFIQAAEDTLREMGITIQEAAADEAEGHIDAQTANDRDIDITARREDAGRSEVSIRVGTFGDEELSRDIYNRIVARL